jgi:hypothetical protein
VPLFRCVQRAAALALFPRLAARSSESRPAPASA